MMMHQAGRRKSSDWYSHTYYEAHDAYIYFLVCIDNIGVCCLPFVRSYVCQQMHWCFLLTIDHVFKRAIIYESFV
jgi:hypothetical protein